MTKSDLNSELKMAATIMTWFSRGIPFGIGQSRSKWNILNTSIKTWMANLSIGDEDNCCQRSSFDHSVSIEPGSLLCSPTRDFKQYWIWPSLRSERKSSKRPRCARNEKSARGSDLNRTMELRLSCTNPSIWIFQVNQTHLCHRSVKKHRKCNIIFMLPKINSAQYFLYLKAVYISSKHVINV